MYGDGSCCGLKVPFWKEKPEGGNLLCAWIIDYRIQIISDRVRALISVRRASALLGVVARVITALSPDVESPPKRHCQPRVRNVSARQGEWGKRPMFSPTVLPQSTAWSYGCTYGHCRITMHKTSVSCASFTSFGRVEGRTGQEQGGTAAADLAKLVVTYVARRADEAVAIPMMCDTARVLLDEGSCRGSLQRVV